jgi:hypothetical protein
MVRMCRAVDAKGDRCRERASGARPSVHQPLGMRSRFLVYLISCSAASGNGIRVSRLHDSVLMDGEYNVEYSCRRPICCFRSAMHSGKLSAICTRLRLEAFDITVIIDSHHHELKTPCVSITGKSRIAQTTSLFSFCGSCLSTIAYLVSSFSSADDSHARLA